MNIIKDIGEYLEAQGVGTVGTNIFLSGMPDDAPADCIAIRETGGVTPDAYIPTAEPTIQVMVRASAYATGAAKVDSVVSKLHQKANATLMVGGYYFRFILLLGEPGHLGRDEQGSEMFVANFRAKVNR